MLHPSLSRIFPIVRALMIGSYALVFQIPNAMAGPYIEPVQAFVAPPELPGAKLIQGSDGNFYGVTTGGGGADEGTVFKVTPAGELTTLVGFSGPNGSTPLAGLVQGSDGNFYGTTSRGGSADLGTVFKMTPAGSLTTLANFNATNGSFPSAGLVQGPNGDFYGTAYSGGSNYDGTVFKITPAGVLTTLVHFNGTNGRDPRAGLVLGTDGNFYGTTEGGGIYQDYQNGTVFKMTPGGVLTTLVNFTGPNGKSPGAALVQGSDGNFYGTTSSGGTNEGGTVFKMTPAGALTTLVNLDWFSEYNRSNELVEGSDGNFYGSTGGGYLSYDHSDTVFKMTPAGVLTTLVTFNGWSEFNGLVQSSNGDFYGTTSYGGSSDHGTVFKMTSTGALTTLVNFGEWTTGNAPSAELVQGSDGNFYGTTAGGYASIEHSDTVFKMTPAGALTTLVKFGGSYGPNALVQGSDGDFYGTTSHGGSNNEGTVFKMTPAGALTTLVNFNWPNGTYPAAGLVQGSDGNFYGTTNGGGSSDHGTVFKMTPAGDLTTLVNFDGANGSRPSAGLVQGSDGNFYGTTENGGDNDDGTVFKVTPAGALTILSNFDWTTTGRNPRASLVQGSDGNFYGTAYSGGINSGGTVFKMTPVGVLTTLVSFGETNGRLPSARLMQSSDGNFYGTTKDGGSKGNGTVFKMTPAGALTTLVNFDWTNGSNPLAGLVQGSDGHLYGTTSRGGTTSHGLLGGGGQMYRMRTKLVATTVAASPITLSNARLNAVVDPGGEETLVTFQYGSSPTLATFSTLSGGTLPAGTDPVSVEANASGLSANTVYYYRIVASNVKGTATGQIRSFTTPTPVPEIAITQGNDLTDGTSKVNFGSTAIGAAGVVKSFTIKNLGDATLSGLSVTKNGPHSANYMVGALAVKSLAPGAATTFKVIFKPSAAGTRTAAIHIASNDSNENPFDISLTGTGLAPEIKVVQAKDLTDGTSKINFGRTKIGAAGVVKTFTIKNLGDATLSGLSVTKNGPHSANYKVGALAAKSLAPGATTTFKVIFKPSAAGTRTAAIHIASNDLNENPFDVRLTGSGLAATKATAVKDDIFALFQTPSTGGSLVSRSIQVIDGLRYLTVTYRKSSYPQDREPVVEVSPNLLDWFSGNSHTTEVFSGGGLVTVRDNIAITPGEKRHIRLKFRSTP